MNARDFLKVLHTACIDDKRFDKIESVDEPGVQTLRVYPFDGLALVITVEEA